MQSRLDSHVGSTSVRVVLEANGSLVLDRTVVLTQNVDKVGDKLLQIGDRTTLVKGDDGPRDKRLAGFGESHTLHVPATVVKILDTAFPHETNNLPEVGPDGLVTLVNNGRSGEDSSGNGHHVGVDLDLPSLKLGEVRVVKLLPPGGD